MEAIDLETLTKNFIKTLDSEQFEMFTEILGQMKKLKINNPSMLAKIYMMENMVEEYKLI